MTKVEPVAAAKYGVVIVPAIVWFMLFGVSLADAVFTYQRWRPIGQHIVDWTRNYPIWLFLVSGLFGAMLGHFFTKPPP
jgi:hypothetical protein